MIMSDFKIPQSESSSLAQQPKANAAAAPGLFGGLFESTRTGALFGGTLGGILGGPVGAIAGSVIGGAAQVFYGMYDDATSKSGLGSDVDKIMDKSPTLSKNVADLKKSGWTIKYGEKGKGSYTDSESKTIVFDPEEKSDPKMLVQTLAHESGHALYTRDPEVGMEGLTKEQYVQKNLMSHLKDEGEATITNLQVREEIMKATGGSDGKSKELTDIGIAGSQGKKYEELCAKYPDPKDRDKLREEIGKVYAKGEHPSTRPTIDYGQYYSKPYEDEWDKQHPAKKP